MCLKINERISSSIIIKGGVMVLLRERLKLYNFLLNWREKKQKGPG
jgi:hypothetical protein